jgi:hypothetical protein
MDISDEYLKMILALPNDSFEDWEWKTGDKAISLRNNESIAIITRFKAWLSDPNIIEVQFIDSDTSVELFYLGNLRPIPSQEQLQDKIIKSQNCKPSDVFNLFQTWYYIYSHQKDNRMFNSFQEAWLHCYMRLDKKEWNGEKWIRLQSQEL